ncbi:glycosyltransferase [bacterium]|jgi:uncharacterized protein|nr:glycosyltransferase [bacterium]
MSADQLPALIWFVKYPEPGAVKTRLAKGIGDQSAVALYTQFLRDFIVSIPTIETCDVVPYVGQADRVEDFRRTFGGPQGVAQVQEDLGQRILAAFEEQFERGCEKVLVIGSDTPQLSTDVIVEAINALDINDSVIGPADDGGYYLLGFRRNRFLEDVFQNMEWSVDSVYDETFSRLVSNNRLVYVLPVLTDVDTVDSLKTVVEEYRGTDFSKSKSYQLMEDVICQKQI